MAHNYIVTASKSTAVIDSDTGNFTGPNDLNLVLAKASRIEVLTVIEDGLKPVCEIGIYGHVESLKLFRPAGSNKDLLFFITSKYNVAILECVEGKQSETYEFITRKSGNIADLACMPSEVRSIVIIDPQCRMIGLRLYSGLFKVLSLAKLKTGELETFNIRMEETVVSDITFLHGYSNPTIAFTYKDMGGTSHLKTFEISVKEKEFILGPWNKDNIASEASILIPVPQPYGGLVVVSLESIVYLNGSLVRVIAPPLIKHSPIQCYCQIDKEGSRYLLGDLAGRLFCLILEAQDYRLSDKIEVKDIRLEYLGEISIPQTINFLDNAMVHIGSRFGDSQLIKLLVEPDENGSFIQVCETYTNLGPISDMCLVDLEKQGQGQLVTCSGHYKNGTLRIIRNGIGLNEKSSIDLCNIRGVWSLKIGPGQVKDNYLFITFIVDSFLWFCEDNGDFINSTDPDGFDRTSRTILCSNVGHQSIIQVTRRSIRLICSITKNLHDEWTLPASNEEDVSTGLYKVCHTNNSVICASGKKLYIFDILPGKLHLAREFELHAEVACLDLNPIAPDHQLLSVGFWFDMNIILYSLPDFKELFRERLNSEICMVPRSIITAKLEDNYYLLCALGDGSVHYFNLDPISGRLSNCKKVTLGTYETILRPFRSKSTTNHLFVCSDRPAVIYSTNNKLVFSNVNLKEVNYMCPLDTNHYSDSLALVSDTDILFGTIDEIQKLHIRTIPLYESPSKIAHQSSTQTLGLLSFRHDIQDPTGIHPVRQSASTLARSRSYASSMSTGAAKPPSMGLDQREVETHNLLIIDQHTLEVLHAHQFMQSEHAMAILSTRLGESEEEYYVVGTTYVLDDEPEPKQGRFVVLKWTQDLKLEQVAELSIKGSPYSLCEFDNKFLAGVNASVNLVELNSRRDLHIECTHVNSIMALYLKRKGNNILMGDLMRSMSLISYKPLQAHFEEISRDYNPAWMTEVEILDDEHFLGAEQAKNIFVCHRKSKAVNEQDRQQMEAVGLFHLGDIVNVFRPGSLVVQHPSERSIDIKGTTLFGTVGGVIGLIMTIDETLYNELDNIQNSICRVIKPVGCIDHKGWRAFQGNRSSQHSIGFIDGDLVESFLDLRREQMEEISDPASLDAAVKLIEEMSRLH